MRRRFHGLPVILAGLASLGGGSAQAQIPNPEVRGTLAEVEASRILGGSTTWNAERFLKDPQSPYSRAQLDALADTLAGIVIWLSRFDHEYPSEDRSRNLHRATLVMGSLVGAGIGEGGVPYTGAADRLLRIAEAEVSVSPSALNNLTRLPNRGQALEYVRRVAIQDTYAARHAVNVLGRDTGPEGLAILRDIYERDLASNRLARDQVRGFAEIHGWP